MSKTPPVITHNPYALWSLVMVGIVAVSSASILIRLAEAPPLTIAAYRVGLATLLLGPAFARKCRSSGGSWNPHILRATLLSGFFLAFHFVFWIYSLRMTSVASSVTLVSTTPLFVAFCSYLWLRERPGGHLGLGILCTIAGSGFIAGMDFVFSTEALWGDLLALSGAVMAAGYLLAGRYARRSLNLTSYAFGAYGTAAVVLLAYCFLTGKPLLGFSNQTYSILILLALVPQLIGHTTFNWALKYLSSTTVAILILGEPIGATILAYLLLGEGVPATKGMGLLLLGTGIVLSAMAKFSAGNGNGAEPAAKGK